MNIVRKKEALVLFCGDIFVLFISLYLTITLRYGELPSEVLLLSHLAPFSILFITSILINFIAGLYENHTLILKKKLPIILTRVQIVNTIVSIAFFYFIPFFTITPKITLFMYLVISLIIMVAWRMAVAQTFWSKKKYKALLLAFGNEAMELHEEINNNQKYGTSFIKFIDISSNTISSEEIFSFAKANKINLIVADFSSRKVNDIMPALYKLIFSGVQFADVQKMYEEIFDKVPLSFIDDVWFLENVSSSTKAVSDTIKRLLDIIISFIFGLISLIIYPFIILAIKLDDKGVIFSYQERVGQNNKPIRIVKFRTMTIACDDGKWGQSKNEVTNVGRFLRKTRLDELPQLWNVLKGDVSLVGPRPEFFEPVESYASSIPYYNVRHIIKPGLSGWAQIYHEKHPHHGVDTGETRNKLSYDLYYVKNRSFLLDIKIILQTLKVLLSFVGR